MSTSTDAPTDDEGQTVIIDASIGEDDEFGSALLTTIASELDADPADLPPLRESVDPDLLDAFVSAAADSATALSFRYLGYEVVVTGDGIVRLRSTV